jgi:hypothetical protein
MHLPTTNDSILHINVEPQDAERWLKESLSPIPLGMPMPPESERLRLWRLGDLRRAANPELTSTTPGDPGHAEAATAVGPTTESAPIPTTTTASTAVDPIEADDRRLARALRDRRRVIAALLVESMIGKDHASALDIAESVHDDPLASAKTLRSNCRRVNEVAEELSIPLRYTLRGELIRKTRTDP